QPPPTRLTAPTTMPLGRTRPAKAETAPAAATDAGLLPLRKPPRPPATLMAAPQCRTTTASRLHWLPAMPKKLVHRNSYSLLSPRQFRHFPSLQRPQQLSSRPPRRPSTTWTSATLLLHALTMPKWRRTPSSP